MSEVSGFSVLSSVKISKWKGKIGILGHMRPAHHPLINEVFDTQFLLPLIFASGNVSIQQSHCLRCFLMLFVYNVYIQWFIRVQI
jgi:hypothetical protein